MKTSSFTLLVVILSLLMLPCLPRPVWSSDFRRDPAAKPFVSSRLLRSLMIPPLRINISCEDVSCRARLKTDLTQIEDVRRLKQNYSSWNDCNWDPDSCRSLMNTMTATETRLIDDAAKEACACGNQRDWDRLNQVARALSHTIPSCAALAPGPVASASPVTSNCGPQTCSDALAMWLNQLQSYDAIWSSFTSWRLCTAQPNICHEFVTTLKEQAFPALDTAAAKNCECGNDETTQRLHNFSHEYDHNLAQCPAGPGQGGSVFVN